MKTRKVKEITNVESFMIKNGKAGDHFYSDKADRHLTAISAYWKRAIRTERHILIKSGMDNLESKYVTKVTLI